MQVCLSLALLVCAPLLCAQTDQDPEVARARASLDKLRELVEAGAVPRVQLDRAEAAARDVEDAAFLRRTLYGNDLDEHQADEMIAAAARRLERRRQELENARRLVAEGVASQLSLTAFLEELDRARKERDLAESRARVFRELAVIARTEQEAQDEWESAPAARRVAERFDGSGRFTTWEFRQIELDFLREFARPLPVSAVGATAVHRALGFDHRNRVDVALHPDQPEGAWLLQYLARRQIPYFAFRRAVPGKATAAHIHIGPMSPRLARGG